MNTKLLTPTAMAFVVGIALTATVFMTLDFGDRTSIEDQRIEKRVLYWVAPMDPNYRRSGPGKSLMGMNLIPVYADRPSQNDGDQAGSVTISPAMLQNLGVRTASVERRDLTR
ncbi:MAG: efflux transporter periplasmic adaptor subunit, partial [Rhodospirillaceae bacterium]|nr:efflux transporter periplasmic adaptor subunit [Rhodospirillaceae bacterium]